MQKRRAEVKSLCCLTASTVLQPQPSVHSLIRIQVFENPHPSFIDRALNMYPSMRILYRQRQYG